MKFIKSFPVLYYTLKISPERIREAFPSILEFKNPTPGSFSIVQTPSKNGGLLVIELKGENHYIFVLPVRDNLILINDTLPRVFVVPSKGFQEFFKALVEDDLERLSDKGLRRKGKKWRFLIDGAAAFAIASIGGYLHLGLPAIIILGAVVTTVEHFLGPRKGTRVMITELNEKIIRRMYEVSEKKGKVLRISL